MASNVQIIAELLNVSENEAHDFCWAVQQIAGNSCDYRIIKEALLRHPDKRTSLTVFAEALKIEQVAQRAAALCAAAQQKRKESGQRRVAQKKAQRQQEAQRLLELQHLEAQQIAAQRAARQEAQEAAQRWLAEAPIRAEKRAERIRREQEAAQRWLAEAPIRAEAQRVAMRRAAAQHEIEQALIEAQQKLSIEERLFNAKHGIV